jgi:hypothetical protein
VAVALPVAVVVVALPVEVVVVAVVPVAVVVVVVALLPLVRPSLCLLLLLAHLGPGTWGQSRAPAQLHLPRGDRVVTTRGTYSCHVHHPRPAMPPL